MNTFLWILAGWVVLSFLLAVPVGRYLDRRSKRMTTVVKVPRVPEQRPSSD